MHILPFGKCEIFHVLGNWWVQMTNFKGLFLSSILKKLYCHSCSGKTLWFHNSVFFFICAGIRTVISAIDGSLGSSATQDTDEYESALEALGQIGSCKYNTCIFVSLYLIHMPFNYCLRWISFYFDYTDWIDDINFIMLVMWVPRKNWQHLLVPSWESGIHIACLNHKFWWHIGWFVEGPL